MKTSARRRAKRKRAMVDERRRRELPPHMVVAAHNLLTPQRPSKFISFCSFIFNLILFAGLIITVCAVLEYHCSSCEAKCSMGNMNYVNKNIEDIARNLASMEKNYHDLETQITQFSKDLPKIEGQLELLGALATIDSCRFKVWEPRSPCYKPDVDINLTPGDASPVIAPKNYTKSSIIKDTASSPTAV